MSKRYGNFDILRGFAILGVVLIHITAPLATDGDLISVLLNQMSRFAVPVFFILSGWGLTATNSLEKSAGYWDFLKARLWAIVPQYLIWNIIYLFYSEAWEVFPGFSLEALWAILREIFLGTIYNHLYFVPIILVFYVVYPLLLRLANRYGVLLSLMVTLVSQISDVWVQHEYFYMNKNIFNWLFYFIFGIWLAKNFSKKAQWVQKFRGPIYIGTLLSMVVVVLTPFFVGEVFDYNLALASTRPTVIVYSIMVVLAIMVTNMDRLLWRKLFLQLSKYSFYIYLSHYVFVSLWREFYGSLGADWFSWIYILVALIVITATSYAVGVLTRKVEKKFGL
jgi:peptidoglycan/LPS O-acetylase OafA/YrhL